MTSNYTNNLRHKERNICKSCLYDPTDGCQLCKAPDYDMFEPRHENKLHGNIITNRKVSLIPEHYQTKSNFTVHSQHLTVKRDATG